MHKNGTLVSFVVGGGAYRDTRHFIDGFPDSLQLVVDVGWVISWADRLAQYCKESEIRRVWLRYYPRCLEDAREMGQYQRGLQMGIATTMHHNIGPSHEQWHVMQVAMKMHSPFSE